MSGMAISTTSLSKHFRKLEALKNISLDVPAGSVYALVGPNGAGKTTLIKILMNIIRANSGTAQILDHDSRTLGPRDFASIGYVSENQSMPERMRVDSLLAYLRPFYPTWDRALEEELVKQFALPLDRRLKSLSRGMKMKAALASSLAYHPKLIVLDEPFSGLDPLVRDELIQGLLDRAEEATVFISSHDLAEIETFATHVGYIEQGELRLSEELALLVGRFREVEVTLESPASVPSKVPSSWMQLSNAASVIRFVDSNYEEERSANEASKVFPRARNVQFSPMSLRSIFLVLAKTRRDGAGGVGK